MTDRFHCETITRATGSCGAVLSPTSHGAPAMHAAADSRSAVLPGQRDQLGAKVRVAVRPSAPSDNRCDPPCPTACRPAFAVSEMGNDERHVLPPTNVAPEILLGQPACLGVQMRISGLCNHKQCGELAEIYASLLSFDALAHYENIYVIFALLDAQCEQGEAVLAR
jgi:hypothetical protein